LSHGWKCRTRKSKIEQTKKKTAAKPSRRIYKISERKKKKKTRKRNKEKSKRAKMQKKSKPERNDRR